MSHNEMVDSYRVNARKTDTFDIFNVRHYLGPNPYLDTAALVFNFTTTDYQAAAPIATYQKAVSALYPHLADRSYNSYAHLFAETLLEVSNLDMDLHFDRWSQKPYAKYTRVAVQTLHARTGKAAIYLVWDWFEAITQGTNFALDKHLKDLQDMFRQSAYGGPTVYSLLLTAHHKLIPTFYLWSEGLMQYGYGRKQIRGIATTFDCDSNLDSDFTTHKDDCKDFLGELGFPVPKGDIVSTLDGAIVIAKRIGYPVAIKPVVGHKGIGATANVQDDESVEFAFDRAVEAIPPDQPIRIIVEQNISGADFRLLCVDGKFVAATERRPASVIGDGTSTIAQLIEQENATKARLDTPTSPLGKIKTDDSMRRYLSEQGFDLESILEKNQIVYLRKIANLSSGGLSIDATRTIHPDNIILAQDIAQHFRLTCLGIDVITRNLSKSWHEGNFGIIEINAAPGIYMHLKPAVGESVDVPSAILSTFFATGADARIPIITFNQISVPELQEIIDEILVRHPDWTIGAVCQNGVFVNRSEKVLQQEHNKNVQNLLRNPKLDLLIAEYRESVFEAEGMFYKGSTIVILDDPTETEILLSRDIFEDSIVVVKDGTTISIRAKGLVEQYELGAAEPFKRVYLKEIAKIL